MGWVLMFLCTMKNKKCFAVKWLMNLYSKMFADVHDLKKSDNRPYKILPKTDVSSAEIGQIC